MMVGPYADARINCPLVCTVKVFSPKMVPVGRFELALCTADATSSMPIEREASSRGSTSMRTAYFCEPNTFTCATPLTIEMRCPMVDCAISSRVESGSVGERRMMKKIDWSAGLTFWYDGGDGICGGSCRDARPIIDCTSCAAASMLRLKSNWSVMSVPPCVLDELMLVRPGMAANCFSSGSATDDAIVSGTGAGQRRRHADGREVHARQVGDRQLLVRQRAEHQDAENQQGRRNRAGDEDRRQVHGVPQSPERVVSLASWPLTEIFEPGHQPDLAVGDHRLTGLEPAGDHRVGRGRARDDDVAQLHRLIRFHDEHEGPLLAGLHRLGGHHGGVLLRRQLHGHVHVLARPQAAIGVGERALHLDRAGLGITELSMNEMRPTAGGASSLGGLARTRSAPRVM
jgi:hypothetical protein